MGEQGRKKQSHNIYPSYKQYQFELEHGDKVLTLAEAYEPTREGPCSDNARDIILRSKTKKKNISRDMLKKYES